ncbi:hypothetical protein VQ056_19440 [Paenibacillus sp. JTLBN-2024]
MLFEDGGEEREDDARFYVQPDFDVICPPGVPFYLRWKLLACTELVQCDRVSVYKLTRAGTAKRQKRGSGRLKYSCWPKAPPPKFRRMSRQRWSGGQGNGRTRFDGALLRWTCLTGGGSRPSPRIPARRRADADRA